MEKHYNIEGMTCGGCKASVEKHLNELEQVTKVVVNLEKQEAMIAMDVQILLNKLQEVLPEKFTITQKSKEHESQGASREGMPEGEKKKIQQLKPLFIILFYITVASLLLNYKVWDRGAFMLDFMGLFYIVFSFFKMLDLRGFAMSFSMYDPVAKRVPFYGKIYPFIETSLGLFFLLRFEIDIALIITIIILGITTIGVAKTLLSKTAISCACLGTALKLPMTEATFIENILMIFMAVSMLVMP
jgi:cation transport ATPase